LNLDRAGGLVRVCCLVAAWAASGASDGCLDAHGRQCTPIVAGWQVQGETNRPV